MTIIETITGIIINLIIPMAGLLTYIGIIRKIKKERINNPPIIDLFLIFATYGGFLLVILTDLFWEWSAMASLGAFYLFIGGPIVMGIIAYRNYKIRHISQHHKWSYLCGLIYCIMIPIIVLATNLIK